MSKTGDLIHEASVARKNSSKGAEESAQNSLDIWRPYARFLKQINCLPRKVKDIPPAAFMLYVHYELSKGIVVSTMKNRTTDIRVVSGRCGKNIDHFTNRFLGIPNRSLHGKKQAIPDDECKRALDFAARTNRGFEFILRFQRLLGLRRREAIQCAESLPEWLASLENGGNTVFVTRGTKNGRHRTVSVLAARRTETIQVIKAALDYSHQFNPPRLLTNRGMKRVLNSVSARYRRAGLKGKFSSHAFRYAFAEDTATDSLDSGNSPEATLVAVSAVLGHGPTRIHFTKNTYLRSLAHRFVNIPRRRDVKEAFPRVRRRRITTSIEIELPVTRRNEDKPNRRAPKRRKARNTRGMQNSWPGRLGNGS